MLLCASERTERKRERVREKGRERACGLYNAAHTLRQPCCSLFSVSRYDSSLSPTPSLSQCSIISHPPLFPIPDSYAKRASNRKADGGGRETELVPFHLHSKLSLCSACSFMGVHFTDLSPNLLTSPTWLWRCNYVFGSDMQNRHKRAELLSSLFEKQHICTAPLWTSFLQGCVRECVYGFIV